MSPLHLHRLEGKVAIVTGGSRGIGEATVRIFVKHGAKVVIADVEDSIGIALADSLSPSATYIHCDVSIESDMENLINSTISLHGHLDILFNNAGILGNQREHKSILNFDADEFDCVMRVNVKGSALGMKHAARAMIPRRSGCIISTASVTGVMGGLGPHAYTASKHAIVGLTKNAACELGKYGIRVNCISPFGVATSMLINAWRPRPTPVCKLSKFTHNPNTDHWRAIGRVLDYLKRTSCSMKDPVLRHSKTPARVLTKKEMLRSLLRAAVSSSLTPNAIPSPTATGLSSSPRNFASKTTKASLTKAKKGKSKSDTKSDDASATSSAIDDSDDLVLDDDARARLLAEDDKDKSLDVGPNNRPLFTSVRSISQLTRKDACTYMNFSADDLNSASPEGLPTGMVKEFEESRRHALLVRHSFLDLRDNFRRIVDPPLRSSDGKGPKVRKQIVLDGPVSCGKSIALAMLVHWARDEGWLDFLKFNEARLQQLPCQIYDPIPLGEGAGVGWMKGVDSMAMPEGSTLYDLVQTGLTYSHAAVGVLVRLRKELSLVKDIPVLIAIDQYNSWFTFSEYEEPVTVRSCRPIHARELATVSAFRSMMHDDMMVGAFSHSTAVGKLRQDLPDVPIDARINFPRYTLDEAATVCHYYLRQRMIRRDAFSEESWKKIYYLSNGNGTEMRWLLPFMR
ncbi:Short-chain dehydrogenase/reductase SDR [Dillenia turbinata]|uniref:Small ribosomal subunit protein mS29 n=1 Tax=Dillenia turbinata TaxID=194707 RepID=A0AAN8VIF8_9MAGN